MLENMSGFVGHAMYEERQRQAHTHRLTTVATPARSPRRIAYRRCRAALATALLTIAAHIAPKEVTPQSNTATATPAH